MLNFHLLFGESSQVSFLCKQRYEIVSGITEVQGGVTEESTESADVNTSDGNIFHERQFAHMTYMGNFKMINFSSFFTRERCSGVLV